jgi:hypothetical protein
MAGEETIMAYRLETNQKAEASLFMGMDYNGRGTRYCSD